MSLGSFSEAQGVFDPELLKRVFIDLAAESQASWGGPRLAPLADRYNGLEYGFFGELWQIEASHVFRIRNNPRPCS